MKKSLQMAFLAVLTLAYTSALADSGYRLLKKVPIPGDGSWDYISVDSVNRHVFVSHGSQIDVLDADSGNIVGKIVAPEPDPSVKTTTVTGVHGAAIAPELGRGFTSNGRASSVTIFDLKTLKPLGETKVGDGPDGYVYDSASRRAFTFSGRINGATAVDGADGKVAGSVDLGGKPEAASADGKGHVFVNIEDKDVVAEIDSRKLTVLEKWPVAPCHEPASMAIDPAHQRLFIGCRNKMMAVMNTENGKIVTTLPIGAQTDAAVFDPKLHLAFSSNGDGTVTVVHQDSADKYLVIDNVKTEPGARTMGLDLKTHRLFLSLADRPAPTPSAPAQPGAPRGTIVPGTFRVLIVGKQ